MSEVERTDQRLPKSEIIRKKTDFNEVFEKGRVWNGKILKCLYTKSNRRMVGFVVSRRFGNAVARNRAKRLLREAYRKNRIRMGDFLIVIMPKNAFKNIRSPEVESEFEQFIPQVRSLG